MLRREGKADCFVISGGGVKGISLLGSAAVLLDRGELEQVHTYMGTSVGALIATTLALGLHPKQVFEQHVKYFNYCPNIDIGNLDCSFGLDDGRGLQDWFSKIVPAGMTFRDLNQQTSGKKSLVITATNLNSKDAKYFSAETTPDLELLMALRMSCAVPLYFTAVEHEGDLYCDGAVVDNFPVDHAVDVGAKRVLGVRLKPKPKPSGTAWRLDSYVGAVVEASFIRRIPKRATVIDLDAGYSTNPLNFSLNPAAKQRLYDLGVHQTLLHMKKNV